MDSAVTNLQRPYGVISIRGLGGPEPVSNVNVDFELRLDNGEIWSGTAFTIENIRKLMSNGERSGEWANGTFFWSVGAIVTETLSPDVLARAIDELVDSGEYGVALVPVTEREALEL
jgi:hypothetical protein